MEAPSGNTVEQIAHMTIALQKAIELHSPDLVLLYGDTNSTLAGALAAAHMQVPIAHVEAGLRSFNRQMPEEINRILTDSVANYLFVTEESGMQHLKKEADLMRKLIEVVP